jgi:tetratricopeptide (TPR) repeat protein
MAKTDADLPHSVPIEFSYGLPRGFSVAVKAHLLRSGDSESSRRMTIVWLASRDRDPGDATEAGKLVSHAIELIEAKKYVEAVDVLIEASTYTPDDGSLYFKLALTLEKVGRLDAAIDFYKEALALDPKLSALVEGHLWKAIAKANEITIRKLNASAWVAESPEFEQMMDTDYNNIMNVIQQRINELAKLAGIPEESLKTFIDTARLLGERKTGDSNVALPKKPKERYQKRPIDPTTGKKETIVKFLERVWYDPWIKAGVLTRTAFRRLDKQGEKALQNFLQNPENKLPPHLNVLKKSDVIDRLVQSGHVPEELIPRVGTALAQRQRRLRTHQRSPR